VSTELLRLFSGSAWNSAHVHC